MKRQQTIPETLFQVIDERGNQPALNWWRDGRWHSYSWLEMGRMVRSIANYLIAQGLQPGDRVAIYSENRPEWTLADYGIMAAGGISVPIYATDTADQAAYIIQDATIRFCFAGGAQQYENVLGLLKSLHLLETVIAFDPDLVAQGEPNVKSFYAIARQQTNSSTKQTLAVRLAAMSPTDPCTVIYTSGTTGNPKGVRLTHDNFNSQFEACNVYFPLSPKDAELCFLPLSHAYARCSTFWVHSRGAQTFYCDQPKNVLSYIQRARPTFMVGVPRFYEKIYAAAQIKVEQSSALRKRLFRWAIRIGLNYQNRRIEKRRISPNLRLQHRLADQLVLHRIREILGGRIRFFSAGGAPLSKEIEEFFWACGLFVSQGYGLTETSPIISFNQPDHFKFGSVGRVIPQCQVRIAEDGEILVKGRNVTPGYFNRPEKDEQAFTADGWLRTGDIGSLDQDGFLYVTDRKKNLIVTAGGKNVAPQRIERLIGQDFYIDDLICIGDRRPYLTALIVVDFTAVSQYFADQDIRFASREDMVRDPRVINFIDSRLVLAGKKLAPYERIKKFRLLDRELSQEAGEVTPTLKIKRRIVEDKYHDLIQDMYQDQGESKYRSGLAG
jgi:long-chain acyl-CoA synthetase